MTLRHKPHRNNCLYYALLLCFLSAACTPLVDQQQARLEQVRAEWREKEYARRAKQHTETFREWKMALGRVAAAEFVHRAPTEENPTPTIIEQLSPDEVQELVAILNEAQPGAVPQPRPGVEPFVLNERGEVVSSPEREILGAGFIDYRVDFLHLYDAEGNEIMPNLSPHEDDISPLSKVDGADRSRRDTPVWEEPFLLLPETAWQRYRQFSAWVRFREAVQRVCEVLPGAEETAMPR